MSVAPDILIEVERVRKEADKLWSIAEVESALDDMAQELTDRKSVV